MMLVAILFFSSVFLAVEAKTFSKCSLATELLKEGVSRNEMHKWVCMAEHESRFRTDNTNTIGNVHGSTDYGIFQINSYWSCDPGDGRRTKNGCRHSCSDYMNTDLSDDVACIKQLLREHRNRGGFSSISWGYKAHCQTVTSSYLSGCTY